MFGIKNPQKALNMLKMFGIKPEVILPQAESLLVDQWEKWEQMADSPLMAVIERQQSALKVGLYHARQDGNLTLWKEFNLQDLESFLKILETENQDNATTINIEPADNAPESEFRTIPTEPDSTTLQRTLPASEPRTGE